MMPDTIEAPISTKETPGPFDGFASAKAGEPIFTLQGGDPLAWRLVGVWVWRVRKMALSLRGSKPKDKKAQKQADSMLIKATEAERIGWAMKEYLRGAAGELDKKPKAEASYSGYVEPDDVIARRERSAALMALAKNLEEAKYYVNETALGLDALGEHPEAASALREIVPQLDGIAKSIRPNRDGNA